MKRKVSTALSVLLVLVMLTSTVTAFAAENSSYFQNQTSTTRFFGIFSDTVNYLKVVKLNLIVKSANNSIAALIKVAQRTPYDDVDYMLAAVDRIASNVFAQADAMNIDGYTVVCEYTEYYVDGRYVMIDPLKVVNLN